MSLLQYVSPKQNSYTHESKWNAQAGVSEAAHAFLMAKICLKWLFHSGLNGHLAIHALQVTHAGDHRSQVLCNLDI